MITIYDTLTDALKQKGYEVRLRKSSCLNYIDIYGKTRAAIFSTSGGPLFITPTNEKYKELQISYKLVKIENVQKIINIIDLYFKNIDKFSTYIPQSTAIIDLHEFYKKMKNVINK